jgi:hypothetical protein
MLSLKALSCSSLLMVSGFENIIRLQGASLGGGQGLPLELIFKISFLTGQ